MRNRFTVILLGCLILAGMSLTSCGKSAKNLVDEFIKADDQMWKTGDGSALMAIEDPNIVIHMFGGMTMKGNKAHVDFIKSLRDSTPGGLAHVFSDATGSGDTGAFRYNEKFKLGTKDVDYDGCMFLHFKNGKVTDIYMLYDSLTLMKAYGLAKDVTPPAPAKKK